MYRRDRLFASDKDRLTNLHDSLKNVRIIDEAAYFNSQPESNSSPSKGRNRDGAPPTHKGGKGGDKGGGGGAGGASGAAGPSGGPAAAKGAAAGVYPSEKGGSAKGGGSGDNYSSHNRPQNRNAGMAAAMQAAMGGAPIVPAKVITGLSDVVDKRSNSGKQRQKVVSPPKQGSSSMVTNQYKDSSQSGLRSNSPGKIIDSSKQMRSSPNRAASREGSAHKPTAGMPMQPYKLDNNSVTGGMNSLLKSPIKNNLQ